MSTSVRTFYQRREVSRNYQHTAADSKPSFLTWVLAMIVLLTGFAVIYVADMNRRLSISLEEANNLQNQLRLDWGQLLLERSTWSTQSRIQAIAVQQLGMQTPASGQIVIIKEA